MPIAPTLILGLGGTGSTLAFEMASSSNPTVPLLAVTQVGQLEVARAGELQIIEQIHQLHIVVYKEVHNNMSRED